MAHVNKKRVRTTFYTGTYICDVCGAGGIISTADKCPHCGGTLKEESDYDFTNPVLLTDEKVIADALMGESWYCRKCNTLHDAIADTCKNCGAKRDEDSVTRPVKKLSADGRHIDDKPKYTSSARYASQHASSQGFSPIKQSHILTIGIFLILAFVGYLLLRTTEIKASMVGAEWSRVINIEEYKTFHEQGWDIPFGGIETGSERRDREVQESRTVTKEKEVCSTNREDLGNGVMQVTTTCEDVEYTDTEYYTVTISDTWYYYDINRWTHTREINTGGVRSPENPPYWGEFELNCAGQTRIGCERESGRTQEYIIIFSNTENRENIYRHSVKESDWWLYLIEREYTLVVNAFGIQNDPLRHGQPEGQINYGESQYTNP